jgi:hypothetical protein
MTPAKAIWALLGSEKNAQYVASPQMRRREEKTRKSRRREGEARVKIMVLYLTWPCY